MSIIEITIDDELKNQVTTIYDELGIDLSTAVRMFFKKTIAVGGIPFDTTVSDTTLKAIFAVDSMRTKSEMNGNSSMTLDEINQEIKKARNSKV